MRTKEFNLEEALNGAKVVTRDGREVTQLVKFESVGNYPLVGVLSGRVSNWTIEGMFRQDIKESEADLFLVVKPKSVWVNVYVDDKGFLMLSSTCDSKSQAIQTITKGEFYSYLKTIEITDEP